AVLPTRSIRNTWLYDPRIRQRTSKEAQPNRDLMKQRTLCAEIMINGIASFTLFDSGCTTDSISPSLAYIARADRVLLEIPMGLQLGVRSSCAKINYRARAVVVVGTVNESY
ncbi:hypothetical protein C8Q80DRAFT_1079797, partial [Daedaleopsis nitida]